MAFLSIGYRGIEYPDAKSALVRGTDENKLVKYSTNDTVVACADGDVPYDVVRVIEKDGVCHMVGGEVLVDYAHDGTIVAVGFQEVQAKTASSLKKVVAGTGRTCFVYNFTATTATLKLGKI